MPGDYETQKLSYQIKDLGPWQNFFTMTANTSKTPGLAPIHHAIMESVTDEEGERNIKMQKCASLFARAWHRSSYNIVHNFLYRGKAKPLGNVKVYWYRQEYQGSGSKAHLPHVHGGLIGDGTQNREEIFEKLTTDVEDWDIMLETSEEEQIKRGLFSSRSEREDHRYLLSKTGTHDCSAKGERCQITKENGEKVCRMKKNPVSTHHVATEKETAYTPTTKQIFRDLGLLHTESSDDFYKQDKVNAEMSWGQDNNGEIKFGFERDYWHKDADCLRAHNFTYPQRSHGVGIPTEGNLAYLLGSSSNVQMTDHRFCIAYVLKYASKFDPHADISFIIDKDKLDEAIVKDYERYAAKIAS